MLRASWGTFALACLTVVVAACSSAPTENLGENGAKVSEWPKCGDAMTTIDGVPAKSNGGVDFSTDCDAEVTQDGERWQCVELAHRYFRVQFGISLKPASGKYGGAVEMCDNVQHGVDVHMGTTDYVPVHGDLVIFKATATNVYGHIAVVDTVADGKMGVVEQNSVPSGRSTHGVSDTSIRCFFHRSAVNPDNPCATMWRDTNNWFCGDHAGTGGAPDVRFQCQNGVTVASKICASGCTPNESAGPDLCAGDDTQGKSCDCTTTTIDGTAVHTNVCGRALCGSSRYIQYCNANGFEDRGEPCGP